MKRIIFLLALLAGICGNAFGALAPTNSAATNRILLIDSSSMPFTVGKATLIVDPLQRTNGVYAGNYKLKVFPYFWKNKNGRLAIAVSDASLAEINQGKVTAITGTATASGKAGMWMPPSRRRIGITERSRCGSWRKIRKWFLRRPIAWSKKERR